MTTVTYYVTRGNRSVSFETKCIFQADYSDKVYIHTTMLCLEKVDIVMGVHASPDVVCTRVNPK